ncbi:terminase large subunit domain-containing protein [Chryseobacterium sp. SG20098]|uniref:terminase large subunit domain-containing protein n=1 Tax=Chryseobacterium sp. SG20098 TaxID=3074145 RepID=UPI002882DF96|nr:terminase family protein [Chryseobacterium sp. SG20098]WNI34687.1 terminase family protein [Chryseobacterium sp. SG20098]
MSNINVIKPQEGYQMKALSSSADIVIGGGAAGAGKTFSLLLEPLRHIHVKGFGAVCFRRTSPMIRAEGGLWDASEKLYRKVSKADPRSSILEWKFQPAGTKLKFSHMQYEENKFDWQGAEIPLIMFDELTHFSKSMFLYMLSRNRSTCGIKPYIRATCNPDPDSWVADFIEWYIEQDPNSSNYGYPIPERQGVVRYFTNENDNIVWGDTFEDVYEKCKDFLDSEIEKSGGLVSPADFIKSFTFIGGSIYENKELLKINPGYLGNLNAQSQEEKLRLLGGNWKISLKGNDIYDFHKFNDIFTNSYVPEGVKAITTDIALKGSDKFIIYVWSGKRLIDFHVMDKSKGNEVIDMIKSYAFAYSVPYSNIVFDNDGVGQFVDGFIDGAKEFNNGARPLPNNETKVIENYNHLKSQCFFKSGESVNRGEIYVTPEAANKRYDDKMTLKQRMLYERKAIKRDKVDNDGKLCVIPKKEMKNYLNGESPDVMDGLMMIEFLDYEVNQTGSGGLSSGTGSDYSDDDYYSEYLNF